LHKGSNVPFNLANTSVHLKQFITSNLTKDASQLILHGACLCMCVCVTRRKWMICLYACVWYAWCARESLLTML
jgi:hypothetical protein